MKIDLIQPRHNYASKKGTGQLYMPTSLLAAGARLLNVGVDVVFHDENYAKADISSDHVGFNLLGAPYIPDVIQQEKDIVKEAGDKKFLVGGRVVSGLKPEQLTRLFGSVTFNGNDDLTLAKVLEIDQRSLVRPEMTSLIPVYERLDDALMKEYLSREFSLYLSQGCKFPCDFCAAVRTIKDEDTGRYTIVKETYRDAEIIRLDLNYLVGKASSFGLDELKIYLSNLDVFQTPPALRMFADTVNEIKQENPGFNFLLRGLSTVNSFINAKNAPQDIEALVQAGFYAVGFGVDGWTQEVWKAVKKGHNTEQDCLEAIRSAREDFGITPEVLMVFGHPGADTEESLDAAYNVTAMVVDKYGAVPRPHVAKAFIPGNKGWTDPKYSRQVELLMQNPESFQALDFTALPSELTHPDEHISELVTKYFLKMCNLPGNTTQYVLPIDPRMGVVERENIKAFNEGRFDR